MVAMEYLDPEDGWEALIHGKIVAPPDLLVASLHEPHMLGLHMATGARETQDGGAPPCVPGLCSWHHMHGLTFSHVDCMPGAALSLRTVWIMWSIAYTWRSCLQSAHEPDITLHHRQHAALHCLLCYLMAVHACPRLHR